MYVMGVYIIYVVVCVCTHVCTSTDVCMCVRLCLYVHVCLCVIASQSVNHPVWIVCICVCISLRVCSYVFCVCVPEWMGPYRYVPLDMCACVFIY